MRHTLKVAMYQFDVYNAIATGVDGKVEAIIERINAAYTQLSDPSDPRSHVIFLGPEYLLARKAGASLSGNVDADEDIEEHEDQDEDPKQRWKVCYKASAKRAALEQIATSTSARPDLLVVPGTILWREYVYLKSLRRFFTAPIPGVQRVKSKVFNTAPILYDGVIMHEYDKKRDAGELKSDPRLMKLYGDNAKRYEFVAGTKTGCFSKWGLNFGIEICADHSSRILQNECIGLGRMVDVHLLISAGMTAAKGNSAFEKEYGALLHNDGSLTDKSQGCYSYQQAPEGQPAFMGKLTSIDDSGTLLGYDDVKTFTVVIDKPGHL